MFAADDEPSLIDEIEIPRCRSGGDDGAGLSLRAAGCREKCGRLRFPEPILPPAIGCGEAKLGGADRPPAAPRHPGLIYRPSPAP